MAEIWDPIISIFLSVFFSGVHMFRARTCAHAGQGGDEGGVDVAGQSGGRGQLEHAERDLEKPRAINHAHISAP